MMISPDAYYEMQLKGKSAEDIARKIRGLKNRIGHLKKMIENPNYNLVLHSKPDERTRLECTRLYFERAIAAFEEAGGNYTPSKAEQRAIAFDEELKKIKKITFMIGGFSTGYEIRTITLTEDHLQLWVKNSFIPTPTNFYIEPDYPMEKREFLHGLLCIHMGEWLRNCENGNILDGIQWEITVEYENGRKKEYSGSNAYPFSFNRFCELVGYREDAIEEDDDD